MVAQAKQLLCHPEEYHPVEEGHQVPWVESMPECAGQEGVTLGGGLGSFAGFLVWVDGLGVELLLVHVFFQGCLHAHVPALGLDLETRLQEKLFYSGCLDFIEGVPRFTITESRYMYTD